MSKQILALSTFVGTIIGVGLFGLPYITAQVGFIPMLFYFLVLGLLVITVHLIYGEIALRTKNDHRLPGYAGIYLNQKAELISYFSTIIGLTGALLAYIIVGGEFLSSLLSQFFGGNNFIYSTIFFGFGALLIYLGSGPVGKTEFFSMLLLFTIMIILFIIALPNINISNFEYLNINIKNLILPYGVLLFALDGMAVVPEIKEILKGKEKSLKSILIIGSIVPIIAYLIFIIMVFGVTGQQTSMEAINGLYQKLGGNVINLGFLFGILTTFTSFITLGITLKKEFHYDRKVPHFLSWFLACIPAFVLYLFGLNNFISIIGFIGAVTFGIDIVILLLIYLAASKKGQIKNPAYALKISPNLIFIVSILILAGIIGEIIKITS